MIRESCARVDATFGFTGEFLKSLLSYSLSHFLFLFGYFRSCSGLSEPAFQLIHCEVYAEWCCDKCLSSKNIPLVKFKP